jgi:hypothetical protein
VLLWIDDLLAYARAERGLIQLLIQVLHRLDKSRLNVSLVKCVRTCAGMAGSWSRWYETGSISDT